MSGGLPWLRLYTETVDDEKLRLLAFEDRWHFIALLCCKGSGLLDAGDSPELLRRKVGVKLGLDARALDAALLRLSEVGLIDLESLQPLAWEDRQMRSDSSRDRVRSFRERQRDSVKRPVTVTVTAQDVDSDKDKEQRQEQKTPTRKRAADGASFVPPDWVPLDAWAGWLEVRRKKRSPSTDKALSLAVRDLEKLRLGGEDPRAVLEQSTGRGWTGLFTTIRGNHHGAAHPANRRESVAERAERINREHDRRETGAR